MRILLTLTVILASCAVPPRETASTAPVTQDKKQLKLEIPDAGWEPIFFRSINERAAVSKLNDLRSTVLTGDNLEVRVWCGFGVTALTGYVIKRAGAKWSALKLAPVNPNSPVSRTDFPITPKADWPTLWKRLTDNGILTLPDSSRLPGDITLRDGVSYVVEINMNLTYRTYMVRSPEHAKTHEAAQMIEIVRILQQEFDT